MIPDPRHIAFAVIREAARNRVTLDQALDRHDWKISELPAKDRALCRAITFGVFRHRGRLDHLIRSFSDRPFDRLDPAVVDILRLALFQLVFLDRVPAFAAIDTAVELTKKRINRASGGFVNAVLRQASTHHQSLALPGETDSLSARLRVGYSIPKWLGTRWIKTYGKDNTLALAKTLMEIPPLTLRVNSLRTSRDALAAVMEQAGFPAVKTRLSPLGLQISQPGISPSDLPGYDTGGFQVQDEAAQLATQVLDPRPGERVLDACAGLGGKTCHIAQLMENKGDLISADTDRSKLDRLNAEARRLGITIVREMSLDITQATVRDFGAFFDRVLVDAPCTGLGVIRRNPDTRWKRTVKDIRRNAARQKKLLNTAASLVRPGGVLVYAVCSCEPEENEGVVAHFLERRTDFGPDTGAIQGLFQEDPEASWFKTFPVPGSMDGFFVARLKRKETQ